MGLAPSLAERGVATVAASCADSQPLGMRPMQPNPSDSGAQSHQESHHPGPRKDHRAPRPGGACLDGPLLCELRGLERRRGPSGKDRVDHAPGSHDDRANALAGVAQRALTYREQQVMVR